MLIAAIGSVLALPAYQSLAVNSFNRSPMFEPPAPIIPEPEPELEPEEEVAEPPMPSLGRDPGAAAPLPFEPRAYREVPEYVDRWTEAGVPCVPMPNDMPMQVPVPTPVQPVPALPPPPPPAPAPAPVAVQAPPPPAPAPVPLSFESLPAAIASFRRNPLLLIAVGSTIGGLLGIASAAQKGAELEASKKKLEAFQEQKTTLDQKLQWTATNRDELSQTLTSAKTNLVSMQGTLGQTTQQLQASLEAAKGEADTLRSELSRVRKALAAAQEEATKAKASFEQQLRAVNLKAVGASAPADPRSKDAAKQNEQLAEESKRLGNQLALAEKKIKDLEAKLAAEQEASSTLQRQMANSQQALREATGKVMTDVAGASQLVMQLKEIESENALLREDLATVTQVFEEQDAALAAWQERAAELERERDAAVQSLSTVQTAEKERRMYAWKMDFQLEDANKQVAALTEGMQKAGVQVQALQAQLADSKREQDRLTAELERVQAGSQHGQQGGIHLQDRAQLEKLQRLVRQAEAERDEAQALKRKALAQLETASRGLDFETFERTRVEAQDLRRQLAEMVVQDTSSSGSSQQLRVALDECKQSLSSNQREQDQLKRQLAEARTALSTTQRESEQLRSQLRNATQIMNATRSELDRMRGDAQPAGAK